ncbi:hypothetical protein EPN28_01240 [Patescibacteria group bacterium]|nr:MAG: hypothetical protein EPN28_01240 [Patescibacteria group bacterium]
MPAQPKFDFLIEYILGLLEKNNINLTAEQKKIYVPQILAQVELRLGLKLLPLLNEKQKDKFVKLMNHDKTTPTEWSDFWHESVPTFDEDVQTVLMEFAEKVKTILAQ